MLSVIERARRYVGKCPAAVSGQRGHDATFHVAAVLWNGFALSEADSLALLREWNSGCQPPWAESELVHKVRAVAGAQHRDQRGYLLEKSGSTSPVQSPAAERVSLPPPP